MAHQGQSEAQFQTDEHGCAGITWSLSEMLEANSDDEEFCLWARQATVGEVLPGVISVTRVS